MPAPHRFRWADLATSDDRRAARFYADLFGWQTQRQAVDTLHQDGAPFASLYRIASTDLARGVPSHWLPYVSTSRLETTLAATLMHGGEIIVSPQLSPGLARIAVIADPTGALVGLWEDVSISR